MVRLGTGPTVPCIAQGDRSGVPVVLLHAWGESLGSFDRLLPRVPATIHALAMDQRGHGTADKPAGGYTLLDLADDVVAFLDAVGLTSAVLLGSSSGGYVAQQVAVRAPDRVDGPILVESPCSLRGRPSFADEVDRLTDPVDRAWVKASLEWFPRFHDVPDWYVEDRVDDGVRMPARVWRESLTGLCTAVPPTETRTITAPTMIIWGEWDGLLSRDDQEALAAAIPGSQLIVYHDTGHLVLWEARAGGRRPDGFHQGPIRVTVARQRQNPFGSTIVSGPTGSRHYPYLP
jgi:rifampin ADP-ribosylating transferase